MQLTDSASYQSEHDHDVRMTRKERELMNLLQENSGQVLSRDFLLQRVWGYSAGVRTRTLDVHIQRLRRKMRDSGLSGEIQTILRAGYCWQGLAQH